MSLDSILAEVFGEKGRRRMTESEVIVSLTLDRDWCSPDQATRLIETAEAQGLLTRDDEELNITFEPSSVTVSDDFTPESDLFSQLTPFEQILEVVVNDGIEKRAAVAGINRLQSDLDITIEAAAVVFARRHGIDVRDAAAAARTTLIE